MISPNGTFGYLIEHVTSWRRHAGPTLACTICTPRSGRARQEAGAQTFKSRSRSNAKAQVQRVRRPEHYALKLGCGSLGSGLVGGAPPIADAGCLMPQWRYRGHASSRSGNVGETGHSVAWDESDAATATKNRTVNIPDRSNPVAKLARLDLNIVDPAAAYYDRVNLELYSGDAMYAGNDRHYLECGASALQVVLAALQLGRCRTPGNILDFGSGAGRVTRWLRAGFPSACIDCHRYSLGRP